MIQAPAFRNIFLAEDDEDDRFLFREALTEIDGSATLTYAENGKTLMDLLYISATSMPDIVFLDLNMPLRNGYECLTEIKKSGSALKDVKVVVMTTSSNDANIDKAFNLGASLYIVKPNNYEELKAVIRKSLAIDLILQALTRDRQKFVLSS